MENPSFCESEQEVSIDHEESSYSWSVIKSGRSEAAGMPRQGEGKGKNNKLGKVDKKRDKWTFFLQDNSCIGKEEGKRITRPVNSAVEHTYNLPTYITEGRKTLVTWFTHLQSATRMLCNRKVLDSHSIPKKFQLKVLGRKSSG